MVKMAVKGCRCVIVCVSSSFSVTLDSWESCFTRRRQSVVLGCENQSIAIRTSSEGILRYSHHRPRKPQGLENVYYMMGRSQSVLETDQKEIKENPEIPKRNFVRVYSLGVLCSRFVWSRRKCQERSIAEGGRAGFISEKLKSGLVSVW